MPPNPSPPAVHRATEPPLSCGADIPSPRGSLAFPTEAPALQANASATAQAIDHKTSEPWGDAGGRRLLLGEVGRDRLFVGLHRGLLDQGTGLVGEDLGAGVEDGLGHTGGVELLPPSMSELNRSTRAFAFV